MRQLPAAESEEPAGHEHALFEQTAPGVVDVQSWVHDAQSPGVLVRSVHSPPLLLQPACVVENDPVHALPHRPALQNWPEPSEHALPHEPQLALSVCVSTHRPEHRAEPPAQDEPLEQLPLEQTGVAPGQTVPQLPQSFGSTCVSKHVPSQLSVVAEDAQQRSPAPMPLESDLETSPLGHETTHAPPLQNGVAAAHTRPHPPQSFASTSVSMHVPPQLRVVAALAQQTAAAPWLVESDFEACPAGHVFEHAPPAHTWPGAHLTPQPPQLPLSVASGAQ